MFIIFDSLRFVNLFNIIYWLIYLDLSKWCFGSFCMLKWKMVKLLNISMETKAFLIARLISSEFCMESSNQLS